MSGAPPPPPARNRVLSGGPTPSPRPPPPKVIGPPPKPDAAAYLPLIQNYANDDTCIRKRTDTVALQDQFAQIYQNQHRLSVQYESSSEAFKQPHLAPSVAKGYQISPRNHSPWIPPQRIASPPSIKPTNLVLGAETSPSRFNKPPLTSDPSWLANMEEIVQNAPAMNQLPPSITLTPFVLPPPPTNIASQNAGPSRPLSPPPLPAGIPPPPIPTSAVISPRTLGKASFQDSPDKKHHFEDFSIWKSTSPPVFIAAIDFLLSHGLDKEGVFRLSGSEAKIDALLQLSQNSNSGTISIQSVCEPSDVYAVCDFILRWLKQEMDSLIPLVIYKKLIENVSGETEIPQKLVKGLIYCMPIERLNLLLALLQVCQLVKENESVTKMSAMNLATCIAPSIMFDPDPELNITKLQQEALLTNRIIEFLIEEFPFLMKEIISGRHTALADRFKDELELGPEFVAAESHLTEERGRSMEDDRRHKGKHGVFSRLSRSRSRKKKSIKQTH